MGNPGTIPGFEEQSLAKGLTRPPASLWCAAAIAPTSRHGAVEQLIDSPDKHPAAATVILADHRFIALAVPRALDKAGVIVQ
jgi:hypothetical protein